MEQSTTKQNKILFIEEVKKLVASGLTVQEASVRLGKGRRHVYHCADVLGVKLTFKRTAKTFNLFCHWCEKYFKVVGESRKNSKFCSKACIREHWKDIAPSIEEKRKKWNERTKKYYQEVLKKRPDFKEIVRERNIKQALRRKALSRKALSRKALTQ